MQYAGNTSIPSILIYKKSAAHCRSVEYSAHQTSEKERNVMDVHEYSACNVQWCANAPRARRARSQRRRRVRRRAAWPQCPSGGRAPARRRSEAARGARAAAAAHRARQLLSHASDNQ